MATVKIHIDSRKTTENKGILKVSITHNRTQRLYTTGIKIDIDESLDKTELRFSNLFRKIEAALWVRKSPVKSPRVTAL